MTDTPTARDDEVIARFMHDYEAADDRQEIVERYCLDHPRLESQFRKCLAVDARLNAAEPVVDLDRHRLNPGDMLDDFRVVRRVGFGGMGEVYEAEQVCLSKRRVALKVIRHGRVSPDAQARFLNEQAMLARLHQTNIVPVFAAGSRDDLQYFAMQYIDGASLGNVVTFLRGHATPTPSLTELVGSVAGPPAAGSDAATLSLPNPPEPGPAPADASRMPGLTDVYCRSVAAALADVADALGAAHRAGVVHRDVKPSNLMVERSGKCWLIDFGLAGLLRGVRSNPAEHSANLTAPGDGTWAYMAPEQWAGHPEPRSDVWSLGVTLYELLTLQRPFPGLTKDDYRAQAETLDPPWPASVAAGVPRDLDAICRKALQKDPAKRYQTAIEFADDLRRWLRGEPTRANPPWPGRRLAMWARREPKLAAAVGIACTAMIGLVGVLMLLWDSKVDAAQAKADAAQAKAATIEKELELTAARAAERELLHQRQLAIISLSGEYSSVHQIHWRDDQLQRWRGLAQDGRGPEIRDPLVATLGGLDAVLEREFAEHGAEDLSFSADGRRLLMGAYRDRRRGKGNDQPARVRDLITREKRASSQTAIGPVGWRDGVPVQLLPADERRSLVIWDVDQDRKLEEFTIPAEVLPLDGDADSTVFQEVALSANGKHVALVARDGKKRPILLAWKTGEARPRASIPLSIKRNDGHSESLAFSPDGRLLALGSFSGQVLVWSMEPEPTLLPALELGRDRVVGLAFGRHRHVRDPDRRRPGPGQGWYLAGGDGAGVVAVWDLEDGSVKMRSRGSQNEVFALAFSPNGSTLATAGRWAGNLWDVATGRNILQLLRPRVFSIDWSTAIAFTPNGMGLAINDVQLTLGGPGKVSFFRLEPERGIHTLRGLAAPVRIVKVSADARRVAALTQDCQVAVWDIAAGELLLVADAPRSMYAENSDVRFSTDGNTVAVAGDHEVRAWPIASPRGGPPPAVTRWEMTNPSVNHRLVARPHGTWTVCRYETKDGKYALSNNLPDKDPRRVRFYELTPEGRTNKLEEYDDHAWYVEGVVADPAGRYFASIGNRIKGPPQEIFLYDGATGRKLRPIAQSSHGSGSNVHLDGSGDILRYFDGEPIRSCGRVWPFLPDSTFATDNDHDLGYRDAYSFFNIKDKPGIHLVKGLSTDVFLSLDADRFIPRQFADGGRLLIWGTTDGTVHIADLPRIRDQLIAAGFPGW
jgi:serine/threonine protein kinase/WD40 repeat protein